MKKYIIPLLVIIFASSCKENKSAKTQSEVSEKPSLISEVDPFIGTGGHGHTYPGASVPFGMLQVSPVNGISKWDWCSGYHYSDSLVVGFSHLSLSGTGIGDLADVLVMPVNKKVLLSSNVSSRDSLSYTSKYSHANETASPGYYQVFLEDPNVNVELTTSLRTAYHKYTFKEEDKQSIVFNLGFGINWDKATNTSIELEDEYTVSGHRYSTGWQKTKKFFL